MAKVTSMYRPTASEHYPRQANSTCEDALQYSNKKQTLEKVFVGAGEMAQQLKRLAAPPECVSSVPAPTLGGSQHLQASRDLRPLLASAGTHIEFHSCRHTTMHK